MRCEFWERSLEGQLQIGDQNYRYAIELFSKQPGNAAPVSLMLSHEDTRDLHAALGRLLEPARQLALQTEREVQGE